MTSRIWSGNPAVTMLVDRQMRNWELARSQRHAVPEPKRAEVEDFVCVSRQVGVDDAEVAARLADRLGWPLFDRELLETMAGDDRLRERIYASMDQRDLDWWEATLRPLMHGEFVRNDYFHRLCRTVLSLARQGSGVFVGRGCDLILPRERGFRVRLVAPLENRVEWYAEAWRLTRREAKAELRRIERQRSAFIHRHFGVVAEDPLRHDLTVNLERIRAASAAELILEARRIAASRQGAAQSRNPRVR